MKILFSTVLAAGCVFAAAVVWGSLLGYMLVLLASILVGLLFARLWPDELPGNAHAERRVRL